MAWGMAWCRQNADSRRDLLLAVDQIQHSGPFDRPQVQPRKIAHGGEARGNSVRGPVFKLRPRDNVAGAGKYQTATALILRGQAADVIRMRVREQYQPDVIGCHSRSARCRVEPADWLAPLLRQR